MPAPSLLVMSTRTAVHCAKYLVDIGNMPYSLARPFLTKIDSPAQLRTIEVNSPHIKEDDQELWIEFIKRDVPQWDRFELPEESSCWYDIYRDLLDQVQREVDEDAQRLKSAVDKLNSKRASSGAIFITDRQNSRHLPKPRPTTAQRYASHDRRMGGIKPTFTASVNVDGDKIWNIDKMPSVKPDRSRSDSKRNNIFTTKRNKALAVPTHQLRAGTSQIKKVPQWLVDEHKQPSPIQRRTVIVDVPKRVPAATASPSTRRTSPTRIRPETRPSSSSAVSPPPREKPVTASRPGLLSQCLAREPASTAQNGIPQEERSNSKASSPEAASPPPAPALLKRRAPPSIFIQPKRRKI